MSKRTRQTINIGGINTADPCMIVQDGSCEDVYNMRYKHNALVSVGQLQLKDSISDFSIYTIIGTASFLQQGRYIATTAPMIVKPVGRPWYYAAVISEVEVVDGSVQPVKEITTISSDQSFCASDIHLSEFGNILYLKYADNCTTLLSKDNQFEVVELYEMQPPVFRVDTTYKELSKIESDQPFANSAANAADFGSCIAKYNMLGPIDDARVIAKEFFFNNSAADVLGQGYIIGAVKLRVAYKMMDGSIIKPSNTVSIISEPISANLNFGKVRYWESKNYTHEIYYFHHLYGAKIKLLIQIPPEINKQLIKSVVVLSTRCKPLYDYEYIHERFVQFGDEWTTTGIAGPVVVFAFRGLRSALFNKDSVCYGQDVFYQIEELDIDSEIISDGKSVELSYNKHYKDITSYPASGASMSFSNIVGSSYFTYNDSLHLCGARVELFNGYDLIFPEQYFNHYITKFFNTIGKWTDEYVRVNIITELQIDGKTHSLVVDRQRVRCFSDLKEYKCIPIYNLLTYPDARATRIIFNVANDSAAVSRTFTLKQDAANNTAYCYVDDNSTSLFSSLNINSNNIDGLTMKNSQKVVIDQLGKLYVSALNNPFYFAPANIYTVGNSDTVIDSLECAADQITETKFGMFPLYVFTNRGTYAMEVGEGEVRYKSVVAIDNETKLPASSTTSALGHVFYVGKRGIMALSGRATELISGVLDTYPALRKCDASIVDFELYIKEASLLYNPTERELIVYNALHPYAYIFSIDNKQWTRREWHWTKLNDYGDVIGTTGVFHYWGEDSLSPAPYNRIITRPMKFGSLEYKRLETLISHLQHDTATTYKLTIEASNDLLTWAVVAECSQPIMRRTTASYKYYRIKLEAQCGNYMVVTHFDVEYYMRFVGKLR